MKISKSIILPEFESIESLEQAGDILHKIMEAMEDHNLQNYEDAVASYRRITTGRIQSKDGETYFDLDSGVIKGEIVFRKGSSGLDNVEEASVNDWDNAFRLANAVKGDSDFTLISGGKIITNSIAVGAFKSDVVARMFSNGESQEAIEGWMKTSGEITYIDGAQIYAGSITLSGEGGAATDFNWSHLFNDGNKPDDNADVTEDNVAKDTGLVNGVLSSIISGWRYGATTYIDGGGIYTPSLAAIQAILGTVHAGTIYGTRFRVGAGTDEDIYFEDSHIRMYDAGSSVIRFKKDSDGKYIHFSIGSGIYSDSYLHLSTAMNYLKILVSGKTFYFYDTGTFKFPSVSSEPSASQGEMTYNDADDYFCAYIGGAHNRWGRIRVEDYW